VLRVILVTASFYNAIATFTRTRKYRLFEADVEKPPETSSVQRVRVQSAPTSSSSLRLLSGILASESAESRAHPDRTRDVWELGVWDPLPAQLQLFCLFNPGNIVAYAQFLPLEQMEASPSVKVFSCLVIQVAICGTLLLLKSWFTQQVKNLSVLHKEVFHEYDTKYVHPQLHPVVVDVGTQFSGADVGDENYFVEQGTPTTLIRRGFQTNPNPNYTNELGFGGVSSRRTSSNFSVATPSTKPRSSDTALLSSQLRRTSSGTPQESRRRLGQSPPVRNPTDTPAAAQMRGGFLGIYDHISSPLKKPTSLDNLKGEGIASPRNSREMAAMEQLDLANRMVRQHSPQKEGRRATTQISRLGEAQASNPFSGGRPWHLQERFPSMR
jgi:hypothetical protein